MPSTLAAEPPPAKYFPRKRIPFEAQRLLSRGLAVLKVAPSQLEEARKGMREQQVLAWSLCQHTTAGEPWVSERLKMGDESRVTQASRFCNSLSSPSPAEQILGLLIVFK